MYGMLICIYGFEFCVKSQLIIRILYIDIDSLFTQIGYSYEKCLSCVLILVTLCCCVIVLCLFGSDFSIRNSSDCVDLSGEYEA